MMVFYHLVRMQNIRSNLNHKYIYATYLIAPRIIPFPLMILLFIICYFLLLFHQNLCFQQLHCHLHILVLISFCMALSITQLFDTHLCNNSSRDVGETNRTFLFTCCLPGPDDRNRSICSSEGRIEIDLDLSTIGDTETEANEV